MIRNLLLEITKSLNQIKSLSIKNTLSDLIKNDLAHLDLNDPHFLDGPNGYIDYYSPYAEEQLKNKTRILEDYLDKLYLIQATLLCSHGKPNSPLPKETDFSKLSERPRVQEKLKEIKDINESRLKLEKIKNNLQDTRIQINNIKKQDTLEETVKLELEQLLKTEKSLENELAKVKGGIEKFDNEVSKIPGFKELKSNIMSLHRHSEVHQQLLTQIPKGMIDLKRALNFNQHHDSLSDEIKIKTQKLQTIHGEGPVTAKLKKEIIELQERQSALPPIQFSTSKVTDEEIKLMLENLRELMSSSVKEYQKLTLEGGELNTYLQKTTGFYWENLLLFSKTVKAIQKKLKNNNDSLEPQGTMLAECINESLNHIPSEDIINQARSKLMEVDKNLQSRKTEHFAKINEIPIRFYKGSALAICNKAISESNEPIFYIPYNAENYALDFPHIDFSNTLGNCFGENHAFLKQINGKEPSLNNICPSKDLMNFQLEQSRQAGTMKKELGTYTGDLTKEGKFAKWENIKSFLTQKPDSKKHGDVCWLKFTGARVDGHEKNVAHAIGFIKMNNPSPYKYILYDYNFGPMGFSNDKQLEIYIKHLFEGEKAYFPYSQCTLEKVDEVSNEGQLFISGIKSLQSPDPQIKECNRFYWNKDKLMQFMSYFDSSTSASDIDLVIEQVKKLPKDEQLDIYSNLSKSIPSTQLAKKTKKSYEQLINNERKTLQTEQIQKEIIPTKEAFDKNKDQLMDCIKKFNKLTQKNDVELVMKKTQQLPNEQQLEIYKILLGKIRTELSKKIKKEYEDIILKETKRLSSPESQERSITNQSISNIDSQELPLVNQEQIHSHYVNDPVSTETNEPIRQAPILDQQNIAPIEMVSSPLLANQDNITPIQSNINDLFNECTQLINELSSYKINAEDKLIKYCKDKKKSINENKDNYIKLKEIHSNLTICINSVNSKEMQAVKKEIELLEKASPRSSGGSSTNSEKIKEIKTVLGKVPLLERIHVFTNEGNEWCNKVRIALATPNKFNSESILTTEGKVDLTKELASSFLNLHSQFEKENQSLNKPTEPLINLIEVPIHTQEETLVINHTQQANDGEVLQQAILEIPTPNKLITECEKLLQSINRCIINPNDDELINYCRQKRNQIKENTNDYDKLQEIKNDLNQHLDAVDSKQMKDIKEEIAKLEKKPYENNTTFFGFNYGGTNQAAINQIKAQINKIEEVLCKIPLLERKDVLTNTENKHYNAVRNVLPEQRFKSLYEVVGSQNQQPTTNQ